MVAVYSSFVTSTSVYINESRTYYYYSYVTCIVKYCTSMVAVYSSLQHVNNHHLCSTGTVTKDDKANKSITTTKPATTTNHPPLSKTTSHRGKQTEDLTSTAEANRNKKPVTSTSHQTNVTPVKSDSQTNGVINNQTTPTGSHFNLPPPPDVTHTSVAEQVCGMSQSLENSREESWKDSQSTIATSSDEWEELLENDLHLLSKQVSHNNCNYNVSHFLPTYSHIRYYYLLK